MEVHRMPASAKKGASDLDSLTIVPISMHDTHALEQVLEDTDHETGGTTSRVNVDLQHVADLVTHVVTELRGDEALYTRVKRMATVGEFGG
jgi:glyceraldehyde-3-phosphate dehydrogenase/erythrose-4-phosphate dehydrogenase